MRRTIKSVLALALTGCAALAATVSPASATADVTFTRTTASAPADPAGRVFYVVYASSRTLFDTIGDLPDDVSPPGYGADSGGTDTSTPDSGDSANDTDPTQEAPVSIPATEDGQFRVLLDAGMADGASSYQQAMQDLELPVMFAGREQWVRNLSGEGVESEPRLQDVSMESIVRDDSARMLLLGRAAETAARGLSGGDDLSYWKSLVPSWAPRVRDELAKQGVPFSVELLADPDINLNDPSKPLFPKNSAPISLFGLGVLQRGERDYLRSLSAEELMLQVWPSYYRYYHRPAGAPVPSDLLAGLTFGSPVLRADGSYLRSPLYNTDSYKRWALWGRPGSIDDATLAEQQFKLALNSQDDGAPNWFTGAYSLYAPTELSQDTIDRYQTLADGA